ncbi:MAG: SDR family oxidoreductase [Planctomycetota bacterium]
MSKSSGIFLTGSTGLLGQYLLQDLLLALREVTVLVRDAGNLNAKERVAQLIAHCSERIGHKLPNPTVVVGDLNQKNLGLTSTDKQWLGKHCKTIVHSAASLSFHKTHAGEPWKTNVDGTRNLLDLSLQLGLSEWHYVSTAFVCGNQKGIIFEDFHNKCQTFTNRYEESKFEAEQLLRNCTEIKATVYRPSVIVGDSRTGYTSTFNGIYPFWELVSRLAALNCKNKNGLLPLRIPLSGNENWNLVPVNWVSNAIVELQSKKQWHGKTFHLVAKTPVSTRLIRDIGLNILGIHGVVFAGLNSIHEPSDFEQIFLKGIQDYLPYLHGNPSFNSLNTDTALPFLHAPTVDREMLKILINYGLASRWGRGNRRWPKINIKETQDSFFSNYLENIFPQQVHQSQLAFRVGLDLTVCLKLNGESGGEWICKWENGTLVHVVKGLDESAVVTFHTDTENFKSIILGTQSLQDAYYCKKIHLTGNLEVGLKLTFLLSQFLQETILENSNKP